MRYFFIAYTAFTTSREWTGNLFLEWEQFPSNKEIRELAAKDRPILPSDIVVTNLFEFDNEEDFRNFTKQKP